VTNNLKGKIKEEGFGNSSDQTTVREGKSEKSKKFHCKSAARQKNCALEERYSHPSPKKGRGKKNKKKA